MSSPSFLDPILLAKGLLGRMDHLDGGWNWGSLSGLRQGNVSQNWLFVQTHLRRTRDDNGLHLQTPIRARLDRSFGHVGDGISRLLKASISLPFPSRKIVNQTGHIVLFLFFFFLVRGAEGYWRDPWNELFRSGSRNFLSPQRRLCLFDARGARRESFIAKGGRSKRLPPSICLDA